MQSTTKTDHAENSRYYKMLTFKAAPELDQRLREAANRRRITVSEVIRKSLLTALAVEEAVES